MEKREKRRKRNKAQGSGEYVDYVLLRTAICVLIFLVVIQAVLVSFPQAGKRMNVALRLEGEPLEMGDAALYAGGVSSVPWAVLTLKLVDYMSRPEVSVIVDGKEVGSFLSSEVTLNVRHGSIVAVRNDDPRLPVSVIVSKKTPNILEPKVNSSASGNNMLFFEPVVIK
ncbi:MAG: hypothetical protein QHH10_11540 [Peptococcaceae bacterium]|nr:hypothetical protein [Peptococcaceae bacterium]MDH7525934.1 hypothetical protein [Peptococcaceae bacterium]